MFRVLFRAKRNACISLFCPKYRNLNIVSLSILDTIETTVLKQYIKKLKLHIKYDRISLVIEKLKEKFKGEKNNHSGHRFAHLAKWFYIKK